MEAASTAVPDPLVVRAGVLAKLKEGQGQRIRASELLKLTAPDWDDLEQFIQLLESMDEEDLIEVDWKADGDGVPQDPDPECWID
jgi:hypothetical protein